MCAGADGCLFSAKLPTLDSLLASLESHNWSNRNMAAKRLAEVRSPLSHKEKAVTALLNLLKIEIKPQVRKNAAKSLGLLGDTRAIPTLQAIAGNISQEPAPVRLGTLSLPNNILNIMINF